MKHIGKHGLSEMHVGVSRTLLDKQLVEEEVQQIEGPANIASAEDHLEKLIPECCTH